MVRDDHDGFSRGGRTSDLTRAATGAFCEVDFGYECVLFFRKLQRDGLVGTPVLAFGAFTIVAQQADRHVDLGHPDGGLALAFRGGNRHQRATRTDKRALHTALSAVVVFELESGR